MAGATGGTMNTDRIVKLAISGKSSIELATMFDAPLWKINRILRNNLPKAKVIPIGFGVFKQTIYHAKDGEQSIRETPQIIWKPNG
jgi:hypothetical protein